VAVLLAFVILFAAVATAATLPTLFLGRDPGPYFRTWALAETGARVLKVIIETGELPDGAAIDRAAMFAMSDSSRRRVTTHRPRRPRRHIPG